MNKLEIAKKLFRKYGLSENVLKVIVALLPEDETATEETIIEQLQAYEGLAKSFQTETERRVNLAKKELEKKQEPNPDPNDPKTEGADDKTLAMLEKINSRLDAMEKGQISANLNNTAIEKLKALKLSDKEIEAVMFERSFETAEAVEEFVEKQGEFYKEITATRTKESAGNGFKPFNTDGDYTKKEIDQDVEVFNQQF